MSVNEAGAEENALLSNSNLAVRAKSTFIQTTYHTLCVHTSLYREI